MSDPVIQTTPQAQPTPPPKPAVNIGSYVTGMTCDGTNVTIPLASLGLTDADVDPATGDIRQIVIAMLGAIAAKHAALPAGQRPKTMIVRGGQVGPTVQYTVQVRRKVVTPATYSLASE